MEAVIYKPLPDDPHSGAIVQSISATKANIIATANAMEVAWLEVAERRDNYDATHEVVDGQLVEKSA